MALLCSWILVMPCWCWCWCWSPLHWSLFWRRRSSSPIYYASPSVWWFIKHAYILSMNERFSVLKHIHLPLCIDDFSDVGPISMDLQLFHMWCTDDKKKEKKKHWLIKLVEGRTSKRYATYPNIHDPGILVDF